MKKLTRIISGCYTKWQDIKIQLVIRKMSSAFALLILYKFVICLKIKYFVFKVHILHSWFIRSKVKDFAFKHIFILVHLFEDEVLRV